MVASATNTNTNTKIMISLLTVLLLLCGYCCSLSNNITTPTYLYDDGSCLESDNKMFQMGFFQRHKTSEVRRYVGIWYTEDPKTVIWEFGT